MQQGLITCSYGRHYIIECQQTSYHAVAKGKKTEYVVGDLVNISIINSQQAQISQLLPRQNLVYRSDHNRSKMIASNLDQLVIVIAAKPNFSLSFLNSCLICAEANNIHPLIIVNKIDLSESLALINQLTQLYQQQLNYTMLQLSAHTNCSSLLPSLHTKRSLLIGQSGVGKSTIINNIYPEANARTATLSKYETSGCHTTTNANLYHLDLMSDVIDSPGMQEFGLYHLEKQQLGYYFPEMRALLHYCRFSNCLHLNEPDCAIRNAVASKQIAAARYEFYQRLCQNLKLKKNY